MNVLMSYGPTASHFYLWNQTRGWMVDKTPAPGGAASALTPLLNNYSTLGGYGSGSGGKEMHLGYFGYSNIYTDFSQAANRDKFFDPVTGFAQELDESGWTEWGGVQPYVWSPDGNLTSHLGSHPAWSLYGSAHALGTAPITLNEIVRQNVPT